MLHLICAYGDVNAHAEAQLEAMSALLGPRHGGTVLAGGDWNLEARVTRARLQGVHMMAPAGDAPTCHQGTGSCIDYFG